MVGGVDHVVLNLLLDLEREGTTAEEELQGGAEDVDVTAYELAHVDHAHLELPIHHQLHSLLLLRR